MDRIPSEVVKQLLEMARQYRKLAKTIEDIIGKGDEEIPKDVQPDLPFKEETKPEAKPSISLEKVRGVLAGKSRDGFTAEVRELITRFGASRLSEIDPKDYEAVLREAEGIGNAG